MELSEVLKDKVHLSKINIFNKGKHRVCYVHPHNDSLCVKVDHFGHKEFHKETEREVQYYKRLTILKPKLSYERIAKNYGFIKTNLGVGSVSELIRDETTGKLSLSLADTPIEFIKSNAERMLKEVELVKAWLFENGIVIRDFHPGNVVIKRLVNGSFRMVIIDGVGHSNFIPIVEFSKRLANKKLSRIFKKDTSLAVDHYLASILK